LRKAVEGKEDTLTEAEANEIIDTCMKVLFCRDGRSINKVSILHILSFYIRYNTDIFSKRNSIIVPKLTLKV